MSVARFRRYAGMLKWLVTIPFVALCLLTLALLGNMAWQGGRYVDTVAIYYTPMFLYMWAIWMIRSACAAIARGDVFDRVLPTLLLRIGGALFAGAVLNVFVVPILFPLVTGHGLARTFEASAMTLGVVGAALAVFAQLLRRASAMRDELDGFF